MRMFELMDRLPAINMEGGQILPSVNESKFIVYVCAAQ